MINETTYPGLVPEHITGQDEILDPLPLNLWEGQDPLELQHRQSHIEARRLAGLETLNRYARARRAA